jgi:hypothetical protein
MFVPESGVECYLLDQLLAEGHMAPILQRHKLIREGVIRLPLPDSDEGLYRIPEVVHDNHPPEEDVPQKKRPRRVLHLHHARLQHKSRTKASGKSELRLLTSCWERRCVPLYLVVDHVVVVRDAKRRPLDRDVDGWLVHIPKVLLEGLEGRFQETSLKRVVGHDQA